MGSIHVGGLVLTSLPTMCKPSIPILSARPWDMMKAVFNGTVVGPRVQGVRCISGAAAEASSFLHSVKFSDLAPSPSNLRIPTSSQNLVRFVTYSPSRFFSTIRSPGNLPPFAFRQFASARGLPQGFGNQIRPMMSGISQAYLATLEQASNNNPANPTSQAQFYSALIRANLPNIVVKRYESGRFASNRACDQLYQKALEKIGRSDNSEAVSGMSRPMEQQGNLSQEEIHAIGQAVGAKATGSTIAVSRGRSGSTTPGNRYGEKENPLYVVVEESVGSSVFKWVKFLMIFGLVTYFALVFLTLAVETTGMIRKVGGAQTNEAQPQHQTVRFSDVHGCEEAKEELQELVDFLKNPDQFTRLGGKLPKGILLVGPPGTGKTLLARAVAGEAGVPFFFMSGSEFDEVYVGVGAKRVRELFANARAKAPAIVFIDELDAIGGKRNERDSAYNKQTLNQLLVDLDGFAQNSGVIFLAATNFPQLLDKALTRPGRFDRQVVVPLPDTNGRTAILKHHMRDIVSSPEVDPTLIARGTPGFSGAELENLVNQAAVRAAKRKQMAVTMLDYEWAKDKIMIGAERRSAIISEKERKMTAYHEGGHALVGLFTPGHNPFYKVTIMPRGQALGVTHFLPEADVHSMTKKEYIARIASCLGGKIAEELIYGPENVTSGCSSDIQQATRIARAMVTQYGMSEKLGDVDFNDDYSRLSPQTKERIDEEVRRIIEQARKDATEILKKKRVELDRIAEALVEYETLDQEEIQKVIRGEKLVNKIKILPNVPTKLPEPPGMVPEFVHGRSGKEEEGQ